MKAVLLSGFGNPEVMYIGEVDMPSPKKNEVLVKVSTTALNRADTMQRKGQYPPPPNTTEILGLEFAGEVVELGKEVNKTAVGSRVCGLIAGGGYAEYITIHEEMLIHIPETMSYQEATAIPEVFLTAFQALRYLSKLKSGERILIHAGASGVGTAAIQLARSMGAAEVIVTASLAKHSFCQELGADVTIDYKSQDFEEVIAEHTRKNGVDVIMDFMGASYFQQNINSLSFDGRMVMLAFMGGVHLNVNLMKVLIKRLKIMGSTLRARSLSYKISLTHEFKEFAMPLFNNGGLKPVIDSEFDWTNVIEAHQYMEGNKNKGKIILNVGSN